LEHSLALKNLTMSNLIHGNINMSKFEILIPLKDNTTHLWKMAITKTYKDIITEPREKGEIGERRFSVIERRSSIASSLRSSGLGRRNRSVGVPRGVQEQINTVYEGSKTSFSMIGRSSYKTVKVIQTLSVCLLFICIIPSRML
jgi:hypothetical protein